MSSAVESGPERNQLKLSTSLSRHTTLPQRPQKPAPDQSTFRPKEPDMKTWGFPWFKDTRVGSQDFSFVNGVEGRACLLLLGQEGRSCLLLLGQGGRTCLLVMGQEGRTCLLVMGQEGRTFLLLLGQEGRTCLLLLGWEGRTFTLLLGQEGRACLLLLGWEGRACLLLLGWEKCALTSSPYKIRVANLKYHKLDT